MTPEQRLWQNVVFRAFEDALWTGRKWVTWKKKQSDGTYQTYTKISEGWRERDKADIWLRRKGADMREVFENAGLDPDFFSEAYIAGKINREALVGWRNLGPDSTAIAAE